MVDSWESHFRLYLSPSDGSRTHFERPQTTRKTLNQKNRNQQISYLSGPETESNKLFDRRPWGKLNEMNTLTDQRFTAINTEFYLKIDKRMKVS